MITTDTTQVTLHLGQHLRIEFDSYPWTTPTTSDAGVLRLASTTMTSSGTVATATFDTQGRGQTQVQATTHYACEPQCLPPDRAYVLAVTVA